MPLLFLGLVSSLTADSYLPKEDYRIACLELSSGTVIWKASPARLLRPTLRLHEDFLVAEEPKAKGKQRGDRFFFDRRTGEALPRPLRLPPSGWTEPVAALRSHRSYSPDGSIRIDAPQEKIVVKLDRSRVAERKFEAHPGIAVVFGDVVVFTYASGSNILNHGGGEVYGYDAKRGRLRWEFDASERIELPETAYTNLAIDGERVLVSAGQTLFALHGTTGKILWQTSLPKQEIFRYDRPWTHVAQVGRRLLVQCYEDLFLLEAGDGQLIWSFDCGGFVKPKPIVSGNRLYVSTRDDSREVRRRRRRSPRLDRRPSAVTVVRDAAAATGYALRIVSRRDLPPGDPVWWAMRPPPLPASGAVPLTLRFQSLTNRQKGQTRTTEIDVTAPLEEHGKAHVKFQTAETVSLHRDGKMLVRVPVPKNLP